MTRQPATTSAGRAPIRRHPATSSLLCRSTAGAFTLLLVLVARLTLTASPPTDPLLFPEAPPDLPALREAIATNDAARVAALIDSPSFPTLVAGAERQMLEIAVASGAVQALEQITRRPPFDRLLAEDFQRSDRGSLVHLAAASDQPAVLAFLASAGGNLEMLGPEGVRPLLHAVRSGSEAAVRFLLARGADPSGASNQITQVRRVIRRGGTPLHEAAGRGFLGIAALLIAKGASPDAKDIQDFRPLHWAVDAQDRPMVQLLLDRQAEVNAPAMLDLTPLHLAAGHGRLETIDQLITAGADVNAFTTEVDLPGANASRSRGRAPLHQALSHGHQPAALRLLDAGAFADAPDAWGFTPLHLAAAHGLDEVGVRLIRMGVPVDAATDAGERPLHLAAMQGHASMARLLLGNGAAVAPPDTLDGSTPLHLAAHRGHTDLIELLLAHGADAATRDRNDRTPAEQAKAAGMATAAARLRVPPGSGH